MWVYDQWLTMHTDFDALPHAELDAVFHHSGNWGQRTPGPLRSAWAIAIVAYSV